MTNNPTVDTDKFHLPGCWSKNLTWIDLKVFQFVETYGPCVSTEGALTGVSMSTKSQ